MIHSIVTTTNHNQNRILPLLSLLLGALCWWAANPGISGPVPLILAAALLLIWLIHLKRASIPGGDPGRPFTLLEQAGAMAMIAGCTLEMMVDFEERSAAFIVMGSVIWWFTCRLLETHRNALAWLVLTLGLTTAPFTELHLERNLWTLSACFIGLLYLIRSNRFLTSVSRRVYLALIAWMLLCFLTLISGFWSVYPYMSIRHAGILVFDGLIFIFAATLISDGRDRKTLTAVLLSFAGVYILGAAWSLGQRIFHLGFTDALGFRIYVFERHPNYAIFFLLLTLPLWLFPILTKNRRHTLTALLGMTGAILYLVFISYSRQSYIVLFLFAVTALFMVREPLTRRLLHGLIVIGAAIGTITAVLNPGIRNRFLSIVNASGSLRFNAWKVFLDLIIERPVFGYGLGTNRYIYPKALGYIRPGEVPTRQFLFEAHNAYIDFLTGLGIVGLFVFLVFLVLCTLPSHRPGTRDERIAVFLCLGIWMDLFFNYRLHVQDTGSFLMVLLAYCVVLNSLTGHRSRTRISIHPGFRMAFVVILIIFCATPWLGNHEVKRAQKLLKTKDWPAILRVFQNAAQLEPLNAHPHYYIALCHEQMENPRAANEAFRTAVNLCPNYSFYRFHLAMNLGELRKFQDAMKQLEAARNLEPYDPDGRIRFNLGVLEWRLGHYHAARNDIWNALMLNPAYTGDDYWSVNPGLKSNIERDLMNFAGVFQGEGPILEARLPYLLKTVDILSLTDNRDFADRALNAAAWNFPGSLDTVFAATRRLVENDRFIEAEQLLYRSLVEIPDNAVLYNYLAYIYLIQERYGMVQYCVDRSFELWSEISIDNYFGYQLLAEAARQQSDLRTLRYLQPKLAYLGNGRYARQAGDLAIHIGMDNYLVNAPNLNR